MYLSFRLFHLLYPHADSRNSIAQSKKRILELIKAIDSCFHFENESIIADKLVEVPMMNPHTPNMPRIIFFVIIAALAAPDVFFKNTHVSSNAGNARPNADRHKAPKRLMNKSNFGIATARRTARKNKQLDRLEVEMESKQFEMKCVMGLTCD